MQTYLSDKILQKNLNKNTNKKRDLARLENGFLILTLELVTNTSLHFCNQHRIIDFFLYTIRSISRKEKISPLRRAIFQLFLHKNRKKIETPHNKENTFSKIVLDICRQSKNA